jgi:hypothetical protein
MYFKYAAKIKLWGYVWQIDHGKNLYASSDCAEERTATPDYGYGVPRGVGLQIKAKPDITATLFHR